MLPSLPKAALLVFVTVLASWPVLHGRVDSRVLARQPFHPFRVIGNIYFVGVSGVSSFLIATSEGSILLDGTFKESATQVARHIAALGFRVSDVKYLLNSHVHNDHAGGLAELKRLTGARMAASGADARWLQIGNRDVPPVAVDRIIGDGETVRVGDTTVTARITPGHTPGCTTWTMTTVENGRAYRVVFYCSTATVDTGPIVGSEERYPGVAADYERSFQILRALPCDVFLHAHPDQFDMHRKRKQMKQGTPNPFVDPSELRRHVELSEREFRSELARQKSEL
jgi:metallo-beta-lactamase class B